ncbi:serine/threonine-protein kinase [Sphaerisporangium sp. B11E5]|uniref:serine/threonine-protein kinase n=1 Tax=Sphaerisporangium sp. B11E5 TaxID=3153563 RepID=UPI00325D5D91
MPTELIDGRYELTAEIESGAMGTVWRGFDSVLDREVAVKVIRPDLISEGRNVRELAERFRREARITARIRHHGVPQVYDAVLDEPQDRLYLVMEYIHGTSLRAYIHKDVLLPVSWAASVAAQIATVLSHAHAVPVVHRDLKPDNILVTGDGTVKVLDFGIAAILRPDVSRLTSFGTPMGTYRYMSPEQTRAVQVTAQSDLYALGCLLHELLAAEPVFRGQSEDHYMELHRHARPRSVRELRPDVPEDLAKLVLELLAKRPEQRPADAYAVYESLLPFLPPPGSPAPAYGTEVDRYPDPTRMYRRPNAPRSPDTPAEAPNPTPPSRSGSFVETSLRDAMASVEQRVEVLLEEERCIQAADALQELIDYVSPTLGAGHLHVLRLRTRRALALFIGGDYRRSLLEFDSLASTYESVEGPSGTNVIHCRRHAADCRAELGDAMLALRQYHEVLDIVRTEESDTSEVARGIRFSIGALLGDMGETSQARQVFATLLTDLELLNVEPTETEDVREMLRYLDDQVED